MISNQVLIIDKGSTASGVLLRALQTAFTQCISFWFSIGQFLTGRVFPEAGTQAGRGWLEMFQAELDRQSVFTVVKRRPLVTESGQRRGIKAVVVVII